MPGSYSLLAGEVSESLRRQVAERADRVCEFCLVHENDLYHGCEVDHIRSLKHDGPSTENNLAFACFHCNRHKGIGLGSISPRTGLLVRFFYPRIDRWGQHFQEYDGKIDGLSEIGEVTVLLFELNHPERVAFRRLLAKSGRYPTIEALALLRD